MIRISRLSLLGVLILLLCVFFPFVGWPAALWWLLLIPVVVLVWILRTQTTVSDAGLELRTMFGSRRLDWTQIRGVRIPKRGYVRADLTDGTEVALPAVSYDRLRELAAASAGRIPDPFAQPEESPADHSDAEESTATTEAASPSPDSEPRDHGDPQQNGSGKFPTDTDEGTR
ncbi:PH domain-containing protein [Nocardia sp. 004]|uniref:PH domain-containing protein n=1 Tax=Nocardia sp. 004 TaxID=3385978 RepID=UPI0039A206F0